MEKKIWLSPPHLTGEEQKYIKSAFETNWIAPLGPNVDAFEKSICTYTKSENCTALSSGTAAIHLALNILGISKGDLVICPTFTFIASVNPIIYQQATPIFIDSEKDTLNMCPELLEKSIIELITKGTKPKAILLVHIYGMPAKIEEIMIISKKYNIPIIEDAADTLGATYKNKHVGTFGEIGIFSFNGNKIITTSGGGALISNNKKYTDKALFLATQARENTAHYEHHEIGYNYRLSNILAGIGLGQIEVLNDRIKARRNNFNYYKEQLSNHKDFSFIEEKKDVYSNRWLTVLLTKSFEQREKIRLKLLQNNIESRPLWKPMHLQPIHKQHIAYTNGNADYFFKKGLCLPSGSNLTIKQKNSIVNIIKNCSS